MWRNETGTEFLYRLLTLNLRHSSSGLVLSEITLLLINLMQLLQKHRVPKHQLAAEKSDPTQTVRRSSGGAAVAVSDEQSDAAQTVRRSAGDAAVTVRDEHRRRRRRCGAQLVALLSL